MSRLSYPPCCFWCRAVCARARVCAGKWSGCTRCSIGRRMLNPFRGSIRTARAPRPHRVRYLNNFPRRWSTGRGVVNGTCWALRRYHSP